MAASPGLGALDHGNGAAGGRQFEVLQVKEKFGSLRFYVNCRRDEAMRLRFGIAADESFRACEVCGQPGTLREERWNSTLCDEHASGQEVNDRG